MKPIAVELVNVYDQDAAVVRRLYTLLAERTPEQSISHKAMPSFEAHSSFVWSSPYLCWYEIVAMEPVGAIYVTHAREVGIHILKAHRHHHYATAALAALREEHPGRLWANVAPRNTASIEFFTKHGKLRRLTYDLGEDSCRMDLIQRTYELPA